jgi:hypothetical protein
MRLYNTASRACRATEKPARLGHWFFSARHPKARKKPVESCHQLGAGKFPGPAGNHRPDTEVPGPSSAPAWPLAGPRHNEGMSTSKSQADGEREGGNRRAWPNCRFPNSPERRGVIRCISFHLKEGGENAREPLSSGFPCVFRGFLKTAQMSSNLTAPTNLKPS